VDARLERVARPITTPQGTCEEGPSPVERVLAAKATQRLRQLIAAGGVELRRVACACKPDTEGTEQCNFGQTV
jgi:hypothetical protein